jgi:hypothetical protein
MHDVLHNAPNFRFFFLRLCPTATSSGCEFSSEVNPEVPSSRLHPFKNVERG